MKRVFWTVGIAAIGAWLGLTAQAYSFNVGLFAIFLIWGACVGYGFGTIFDQRHVGKRIIGYWSVTLALVGTLLGPLVPLASDTAAEAVAAAICGFVGGLVGFLHLRLAQYKPLNHLRVRTRKMIWIITLTPFGLLFLWMIYRAEQKSIISTVGQVIISAVTIAFIGGLIGAFYAKFGERKSAS